MAFGRQIFFLFWGLIATAAMGQATVIGPAGAEATRPGWRLLDGRWIQPAGTFRFFEVVKCELDGGRLCFAIQPSDFWRPKLINGRRIVAELLPEKVLWRMMYGKSTLIAPVAQRGESLVLFDAEPQSPKRAAPAQIRSLVIAPGGVLLRGVGRVDGKNYEVEYQSARDGRQPRLTIIFDDRRGLDVTGEDLFDLLQKRPQIVRQFLSPLLSEVAGANLLRPRAADVYRVFDDILPTVQEQQSVAALLPELDAHDRSTREAASEKLEALGASAVLVALRLDASRLTPEQAARLGDFVTRNSLGDLDPVAALGDYFFLRESAQDDDPRVRDAARQQLELLSN